MASFYYYDHNPSEYCSLAQIKDFCYLNPTGTTKFKYERVKELRACLHGGGGPQVGEVTRLGGVTRLSI